MKNSKSLLRIALFAFFLGASTFMISCEDDESDCSDCSADAPYSNSSTTQCYASLADCEDKTGKDCMRCN